MKKFVIKLHITLLLVAGLFGFVPATTPTAMAAECKKEVKILTIAPWYSGLCKSGSNDVEVEDVPDGVPKFATNLILNLLSIALQVGGYVAVGFVIWGGFKYIIATGDSTKLASARGTIKNALVGLLIALSAVAILNAIQSVI